VRTSKAINGEKVVSVEARRRRWDGNITGRGEMYVYQFIDVERREGDQIEE